LPSLSSATIEDDGLVHSLDCCAAPKGAVLAALGAVLAAFALAAFGLAVFRSSSVLDDASVWRQVFADRATTGFLRAAIIALAVYAIASTAALVVGGRWLRGLSTSGLQVDEVNTSEALVEEYRAMERRAEEARDEMIALAEEMMRWLNQT